MATPKGMARTNLLALEEDAAEFDDPIDRMDRMRAEVDAAKGSPAVPASSPVPVEAPAPAPAPVAPSPQEAPPTVPAPAAAATRTAPAPALPRQGAGAKGLRDAVCRRAVDIDGGVVSVNAMMPEALWQRLLDYEERLLVRHDMKLVRATLLTEALRRLPDDLSRAARLRPTPEDMAEAIHGLNTRVPKSLHSRVLKIRAVQGRGDRDLTLQVVIATAVARLLGELEAELDALEAQP